RHPWWVAEEIGAPERRDHSQPAERRPQPQENESDERKSADERIALRMDWRELRTDRVDDGHQVLFSKNSVTLRRERPRASKGDGRGAPAASFEARAARAPQDDDNVYSAASAAGSNSGSRSSRSAGAGGLRLGVEDGSSTSARISRAISASRWRFHMLA